MATKKAVKPVQVKVLPCYAVADPLGAKKAEAAKARKAKTLAKRLERAVAAVQDDELDGLLADTPVIAEVRTRGRPQMSAFLKAGREYFRRKKFSKENMPISDTEVLAMLQETDELYKLSRELFPYTQAFPFVTDEYPVIVQSMMPLGYEQIPVISLQEGAQVVASAVELDGAYFVKTSVVVQKA